MAKKILITGATDGLGLDTARKLLKQGHIVLLHGRTQEKIDSVIEPLSHIGRVVPYIADLSDLHQTLELTKQIKLDHPVIDVIINNAGVFVEKTITHQGSFGYSICS